MIIQFIISINDWVYSLTMEFWEYQINKAHENIALSKKLFDDEKFGLSAFHAQQGLEMAIKAFCYRKKIDEIFESEKSLKTHLPSAVLIEKYFRYIIDLDNQFDRRSRGEELEEQVNKVISILEKLKSILDGLKYHKKMNQVWKYSLKIKDDSKVQKALEEIQQMQSNIPLNFFDNFIETYRSELVETINKKKYIKEQQRVQKAIDKAKKTTSDLGFSKNFVNSFLDITSNQWKSEIKSFVITHGAIRSFDIVMGEDGLFSNLYGITNKKTQNSFVSPRWLAWIGLISPSILLSFPHEQIGRYPVMIDNKMSEDWYKEKKNELLLIIEDCAFGIKRIKEMIY